MRADIERTIMHYYPQRALVSPVDNDAITWDWDPSYTVTKSIVKGLESIDPDVHPGTHASYDISEELVLLDRIHLHLSYIGPYAAIDYVVGRDDDDDEDVREAKRNIEKLLDSYGVLVLTGAELDEAAPWIMHGRDEGKPVTVWQCLFLLPS